MMHTTTTRETTIVCLSLCWGLMAAASYGLSAEPKKVPEDVRLTASCIGPLLPFQVPQSALARFQSHALTIRYYVGDDDTPQSPMVKGLATVWVAVYTAKESDAVLLKAVVVPDKRWVLLGLDPWNLERRRGRWRSISGDGSAGVQHDVEVFVGRLGKTPAYRLRDIAARPAAECVGYFDWAADNSKYLDELEKRRLIK